MGDSILRRAVGFAVESLLRQSTDRDATLDAAEAELVQLLATEMIDAERQLILNVIREEIAKARTTKH